MDTGAHLILIQRHAFLTKSDVKGHHAPFHNEDNDGYRI